MPFFVFIKVGGVGKGRLSSQIQIVWNKEAIFVVVCFFVIWNWQIASMLTSECGKTSVTHSSRASCATFLFFPHFDVICDLLLNRRTATWNLFVLYNKVFYFKIFQHDSKAGLCPALRPLWQTRKRAIWLHLLSIQMKQSHCLLCVAKEFWLVQENHATVKLDSSGAPRGMKTYSESKTELWNLQILKKMLEK